MKAAKIFKEFVNTPSGSLEEVISEYRDIHAHLVAKYESKGYERIEVEFTLHYDETLAEVHCEESEELSLVYARLAEEVELERERMRNQRFQDIAKEEW